MFCIDNKKQRSFIMMSDSSNEITKAQDYIKGLLHKDAPKQNCTEMATALGISRDKLQRQLTESAIDSETITLESMVAQARIFGNKNEVMH
jgi:DNA-binding phage protein